MASPFLKRKVVVSFTAVVWKHVQYNSAVYLQEELYNFVAS